MEKEKTDESGSDQILFSMDISAKKKFHELMLSYTYLDAVRSLAAGVTHNYNNIFGGLIGQFAILRSKDLPAEEKDAALGLINDLLQRGTRISSILSPFIKKKVDAACDVAPVVMVHEVAELLGLLSSSHRIIPGGESNLPFIHCAPRRLLLMLFSLGRNAIEAMPEGGTVEISACSGDDRFDPLPSVVFSVNDHGTGIAEEYREHIFTPFFSTKQSGEYQEAGLSLHEVRDYVLQQHGTVEFDTAVDRGSAFRLILPAIPPRRPRKVGDIDHELARPVQAEEEADQGAGSPQVILVVEDEQAIRTMITSRLQNAEHIVFSVQNGQEAIEEYFELHDTITTVIMDAGLPDMTGQQCVRRLMEIDPDLTVLYMSGGHLEGDELYPPGAPLLLKPFTAIDLHKAIGNASKRDSTELS